MHEPTQRLQQLFLQMPQGVVFLDRDGRVVDCNPAAEAILGIDRAELLERRSRDLGFRIVDEHGAELADAELPARSALETGERVEKVIGVAAPTGDGYRWLRVTAIPLPAEVEPGRAGVCSILEDVTELRRVEQELRDEERRYRTLFEDAPVGIYQTTSSGQVVTANPAVARMLRCDTVEAALAHYRDLRADLYVDPGRRDEFLRIMRQQGHVDDFEYEARTADGKSVWLSMSARIADRHDDDSFSIEGYVVEITRRKRAEGKFALFMENAPVIAFLKDRSGRYVWANARSDAAAASPVAGEATGFALQPGVAAEVIEALRAQDRVVFEQGIPVTAVEMRMPLAGGQRYLNIFKFPVPADDDELLLGAICIDVTDQVEQARALHELENQFQQSQKMETVGRLAGGVAHDFNNLLTVINSYAGFIAEDLREGDPMLGDVREIAEAGKRAATLTQQLLAFSRRQVLEPRVIDLNDVVGGVHRMLGRLIGEDIRLVTELAPDLGLVTADPSQLEQVLMNLAINARDAMPRGGTLTIGTRNRYVGPETDSGMSGVAAGSYVSMSVTDTGHGMEPRVASRVFEPFFTTKEKGRGTGLGLSTVYGVVAQSGGTIEVDSTPGQGTSFCVYLPRVDAEKSSSAADAEGSALRGTETVLLVEDEAAVRELTRRILAGAGYAVLTAANAGEALLHSESHQNQIDLLLTDVVMPQMSGRSLAQRLVAECPSLRVLYISGYTDDAALVHQIRAEKAQLVAKPFTAAGLLQKLRAVLDGAD